MVHGLQRKASTPATGGVLWEYLENTGPQAGCLYRPRFDVRGIVRVSRTQGAARRRPLDAVCATLAVAEENEYRPEWKDRSAGTVKEVPNEHRLHTQNLGAMLCQTPMSNPYNPAGTAWSEILMGSRLRASVFRWRGSLSGRGCGSTSCKRQFGWTRSGTLATSEGIRPFSAVEPSGRWRGRRRESRHAGPLSRAGGLAPTASGSHARLSETFSLQEHSPLVRQHLRLPPRVPSWPAHPALPSCI